MVKKTRTRTTVNADAVKRDVNKFAKELAKNSADDQGRIELAPGSVRRESTKEQDMGPRKYREMIHDHNSKNSHILDRLPFTFPRKKLIKSNKNVVVLCEDCSYPHLGTEYTVGFVCPECKTYVSAINPEAERTGYDPEINVGIFGTASDKLELKEKKRKKL